MKKAQATLIVFVGYFLAGTELDAQKGTAPDGYYPSTYSGNIFTGNLQPISKDAPEFTLVYTNGRKSDKFRRVRTKWCNGSEWTYFLKEWC